MPEKTASTVTAAEAVRAILHRAGIVPTQQRMEIAQVMLCRHQHLSADRILALANRQGHAVSKATVYNTLNLFARKGVVREVLVDPNRVFYDSNTDPHYHLYNEDTGDLVDIDLEPSLLALTPDVPEGTELVGVDLVIRLRNART